MSPRDDLRDHVVGGMLADLVDALDRSKALHEPTEHELAVVRGLAELAFRTGQQVDWVKVDPVSLDFRQLKDLAERGRAADQIAETWPAWPSHPLTPLSDKLKVADRETVDRVYGWLHRLGHHDVPPEP